MLQRLRAVVVIPLYAMPRDNAADSAMEGQRRDFLGVIYLDSRRPFAFSKLDRRILDALGVEAASILHNAHLAERERESPAPRAGNRHSPATSSKPFFRAASAISLILPPPASISRATPWAGTTSTFFPLATSARRS